MCGRPQVFGEYQAWLGQYSHYTEMLPTRSFLAPLDEDEEIEVEVGKGQAVVIKYKALSELQPNGMRRAPAAAPPGPSAARRSRWRAGRAAALCHSPLP
jgi:pyruvate carboxylase